MKCISIIALDEDDKAIIEKIVEYGVDWNAAKIVTYLSYVDKVSTWDISVGADMMHWHVCRSLRPLRVMGWITELNGWEGKNGRPEIFYSLRTSIEDILAELEAKKQEDVGNNRKYEERLRLLRGD